MPNKVVLTGSYDFGEAPVALMDVHSQGVDNLWLQKRASVLIPELDGYKAASGRSPLHLIALGTTETYGPNANADGFCRYWQEKNGHTFLSDGHVYKEHVNKDPKKASGEIKIAKFNPKMDRTELVIEVDNNKWADELQKVASGKDIFFSMAATVPYDVCSICDNKARSRMEYCGCMKKHAGQILDDGQRVYVDNPHPKWFDISGVYRPADKIAYVMGCPCMEKGGAMVKSGSETPILGVDLYDALYPTFRKQSHSMDVPSFYAPMKRRLLSKLAAIEKEIELVAPADENIKNLSSAFATKLPTEPFGDLFSDCKGEVVSKLASMQIILPLRTFLDLVGAEIEPEQVEECLPGIFSELDEDNDCIADSGTYDPGGFNILPQSFLSALPGLFEEGSFADEPTRRRISITIIRKSPVKALRGPVKIHSIKSAGHAEAKLWAREYANYKLAQLAALHDDGIREKDAKMAVLQNYVRTSEE